MKVENFILKNIKKIRKVKNLNQTQFADILGVSRASIGSYEEGRAEPRIETLQRLAKKFSIPLGRLIQEKLTVNEINGFSDKNNLLVEHEIPVFINNIPSFPKLNNPDDYWIMDPLYNTQLVTSNSISRIPSIEKSTLLLWRVIKKEDLVFHIEKPLIIIVDNEGHTGLLKGMEAGNILIDCLADVIKIEWNQKMKIFGLGKILKDA
jgi:transcriptional regulator with XRE-family HTH domain